MRLTHPSTQRTSKKTLSAPARRYFVFAILSFAAVFAMALSIPAIVLEVSKTPVAPALPEGFSRFPVTVDPGRKLIVEDPRVEAFFDRRQTRFSAAAGNAGKDFFRLLGELAAKIVALPWYQSLAAVNERIVVVEPGMRKEQVTRAFSDALGWNAKEDREFTTARPYAALPLPEGSYAPGTYVVEAGASPLLAQALVNDRFSETVLDRYGTTTARIVPLHDALTIASIIDREAGGEGDARIISGIIWNRLFAGMHLQIDATVQYAKANREGTRGRWPPVTPADLSLPSPYNTYRHQGLPPGPIANPSVDAILAALNPVKTPCFFYFHDRNGGFHCADTYKEHVALLKKFYGRGK